MTPAWAAPICGLSEEDIVGSARLYASGNNAAIQWGLAFDQQVSAMALNLAVCDLMAICGNIDRPGGNILVRNSFEINAGYALSLIHISPWSWTSTTCWRAKTWNTGSSWSTSWTTRAFP